MSSKSQMTKLITNLISQSCCIC